MAGFPIELPLSCARNDDEDTGTLSSLTDVETGYEAYGEVCGYFVTYTWYGDHSTTITIHTNESIR